jgi:hypothetical protein
MKHNINYLCVVAFNIVLIVAGLLFLDSPSYSEETNSVLQNQGVTRSTPNKSPWSVYVFNGIGIFGTGDESVLLAKEGQSFFAFTGFKPTRAQELSVGYRISDWFALRAGYQKADLDFGADLYDFNDTSFQAKSVQIFTACNQLFKFAAFFEIEDAGTSFWKPFETSYDAGLMIGYSRPSNIRLSQGGIDVFGIDQVSMKGGLSAGLEAGAKMRLGRSNWSLGLNGTLMFNTGGTKLSFRTSGDSMFKSTSSHFLGNTMGLTLSYRFP